MGLSRRQIPYISASVALIVGGLLFFAFPIRNIYQYYIDHDNRYLLVIPICGSLYLLVMYLFVLSVFFLSSFVDPGIYPRESTNEEDDFSQPLYKLVSINGVRIRMKWCETCNFYRPPRCSHCSICDNCVEGFDHHCPWVDNCIGRRNYKYFFMFVNSLSFFILNGFGWAILSIILHNEKDNLIQAIMDFILIAVGIVGVIPVIGLAGFHCGLVCLGRTTNEHVTGKFRSTENPFDMGCRQNCSTVLCAPKRPRYMHYIMTSYYRPQLNYHMSPEPMPERTVPVYEEVDSARRAAEEISSRELQNMNTTNQEEVHYDDALMTEITV